MQPNGPSHLNKALSSQSSLFPSKEPSISLSNKKIERTLPTRPLSTLSFSSKPNEGRKLPLSSLSQSSISYDSKPLKLSSTFLKKTDAPPPSLNDIKKNLPSLSPSTPGEVSPSPNIKFSKISPPSNPPLSLKRKPEEETPPPSSLPTLPTLPSLSSLPTLPVAEGASLQDSNQILENYRTLSLSIRKHLKEQEGEDFGGIETMLKELEEQRDAISANSHSLLEMSSVLSSMYERLCSLVVSSVSLSGSMMTLRVPELEDSIVSAIQKFENIKSELESLSLEL